MNTIVFGVDGSAESLHAAKYAAKLAATLDDRLVIAFVDPPIAPVGPGTIIPQTWLAAVRAEGKALLQKAADACASTPPPEQRFLEGPVAQTLSKLADEEAAELIVVGRGGQGQLIGTILGSVADRLVHIAKKPVLLLPHQGDGARRIELPEQIQRIVVGVDGSAASRKAVALARSIAQRAGTKLVVLVHAVAPIPGRTLRDMRWWEAAALSWGERLARDEAASMEWACETVVRMERPALLLGQVAEERDADLVIAGHRGLGEITRLLVGSVATEVLRESRRPVLVAR